VNDQDQNNKGDPMSKFLIAPAALMMALALAACGGDAPAGGGTPPADTSTPATTPPPAEPAPATPSP
jgi:ABC-type glycerol-3-phosphate transport system substrate-binding protein